MIVNIRTVSWSAQLCRDSPIVANSPNHVSRPSMPRNASTIRRQRRIVPEGDGHPNQPAREETDPWLNSGDQLEIMRLVGFFSRFNLVPVHTQEFLRDAIELRDEFFHCCVFAGNFTSFSTVQSYLCSD
jgi:hypothetical protein